MKKNTKGFTLIELLAVIVILAIIALIAVPVIMNIITKARKSAAADTAYSVLDSAELYYANQLLDHPDEAIFAKEFTFTTDGNSELDLQGTKPTAGTVSLDDQGNASIKDYLTINNFRCTQSGTTVSCENNK